MRENQVRDEERAEVQLCSLIRGREAKARTQGKQNHVFLGGTLSAHQHFLRTTMSQALS